MISAARPHGPDSAAAAVDAHYGRPDLLDAILQGLRASGCDPDAPAIEDLAPVDHFHTRGRDATLALGRLAKIASGHDVLDVGGGLGGAARLLARMFDARVTVLDLTEAFCQVGAELTRRTGLAERVTFRQGTALDLPFPDERFDVAWTQHSSMNVDDKERLYAEIHRVLRAGGRLAIHEVTAGPAGGPLHLPVPWAAEAGLSFLRQPEAIQRLLADLGFEPETWIDTTAVSIDAFRERVAAARAASELPPLGLHLILGPGVGRMLENVLLNLEENRIVLVKAVLARPGGRLTR
jgi:ubiquinone/menaquinone biosynthesis C-methylase UbiE